MRSLLKKASEADMSYEDGKVLGSMCTMPHALAEEAHHEFVLSNLGDPGLFEGTASLEDEVVRALSDLMQLERGGGYVTTGGTESNIQAMRIFRDLSGVDRPNVVVPKSAHFSFDKAGDLLGLDLKKAELDDVYRVRPDSVEELIDDGTVGVLGIAGTTETGQVDPIRELSEIAEERDLFLHVDAAFGGFVLPFLPEAPEFDFSLDGVDSMTVDPHKMGLSTVPAGGLLVREPSMLEPLKAETPYLSSDEQHSLVGTRPGTAAASAYAAIKSLGREGYRKVATRCLGNARRLTDGLSGIEGVRPAIEPVTNVVSIMCGDPPAVCDRLEEEGWSISVSKFPEALRVVVMPHVTKGVVDSFLDELEDAVDS